MSLLHCYCEQARPSSIIQIETNQVLFSNISSIDALSPSYFLTTVQHLVDTV